MLKVKATIHVMAEVELEVHEEFRDRALEPSPELQDQVMDDFVIAYPNSPWFTLKDWHTKYTPGVVINDIEETP